jgi:hypothetical protein
MDEKIGGDSLGIIDHEKAGIDYKSVPAFSLKPSMNRHKYQNAKSGIRLDH